MSESVVAYMSHRDPVFPGLRSTILCKPNNIQKWGVKMHITYKPKGVCSRLMEIDVEDGRIEKVEVTGGCSGNLSGISRLLVGMSVEDAIARR